MSNIGDTFLFRELVPDMATFQKIAADYSVLETSTFTQPFAAYMFRVVWRRYNNYTIMYDRPNDFYNAFFTIWDDMYTKYYTIDTKIKKLYNLTDDELLEVSRALSNVAVNPNNEPIVPTDPLNYVSNQATSYGWQPKLLAYMQYINNLPALQAARINMDFVGLFRGFGEIRYWYAKDKEEEKTTWNFPTKGAK